MVKNKVFNTVGIKSKEFGCIWKTMFIVAMTYPEKYDGRKRDHKAKKQTLELFYSSLTKVIPCKFCRDFCSILEEKKPLDFSGRVPLMYSIYLWKDLVNKKLIAQGNKRDPSPPFNQIKNYYEDMRATCDPEKGVCS